ncbi:MULTISPECIES: hypothetical protein [unclassified Streptomyces]|uniref:hypothetical protein n=1 Tax=unclassified Streptomyces TaxID=2593676 RepID=UPI001BB07BE1|nr:MULTISPECIES: hypothetical protein [unclassified Streptomyces]QUW94164.1 hypothetical protein KE639_05422 [Streptomyces sp. V17-9]WKX18288.1 hypothetical protein Q3Y68_09655 [Streptomyces sp. HUAS CX7]
MAVVCVVVGFQGLAVRDDGEWSDDGLTSGVEGATLALDGSLPTSTVSYARKVEQSVVEHSGGDAPQLGVPAISVGPSVSDQGAYRITADGANAVFCMDVKQSLEDSRQLLGNGGVILAADDDPLCRMQQIF